MMKKGILACFFLAAAFSAITHAARFEITDPKSCASLGGAWASNAELPPQIGRCVMGENFILASKDELYVGPGVVLVLNSAGNNIAGSLYVSRTAVLRILGGTRNIGVIDIEDDAELQLWGGYLDNAGFIVTEGYFDIFPGLTLYNTGTIRNYGGGEINNDGTVLMYSVGGVCEINNDMGGKLINRKYVYLLSSCVFNNLGVLENHSLAFLNVNGYLYNQLGARLDNRGWLDISSGEVQNDNATFRNRDSGLIWIYGSGKLINTQSALLTNDGNARIQISAPASLDNLNMARVESNSGTEIFIDDGVINNSAMFVNRGTLKNDTSNNSVRGQFNNNRDGYVDNAPSGVVLNTFGTFYNNSGATLNNRGGFWTCFGSYQGTGIFMGNTINSCLPRPNFPTPPTFPR